MRNRVRVMCKPGSVGDLGGQPPRSTRPGILPRAETVDRPPSLWRMMNADTPPCSSDRGRILRREWPANAGVNIAEKTALPLIPGNDGLGPTGYVLGESCRLTAGWSHCGEYATVGFRTVAAVTPGWTPLVREIPDHTSRRTQDVEGCRCGCAGCRARSRRKCLRRKRHQG